MGVLCPGGFVLIPFSLQYYRPQYVHLLSQQYQAADLNTWIRTVYFDNLLTMLWMASPLFLTGAFEVWFLTKDSPCGFAELTEHMLPASVLTYVLINKPLSVCLTGREV